MGPYASERVAQFCDRHYSYNVLDSQMEGLKAYAAFEFHHSKQVIVHRELARIAGSIISVALASGSVSSLLTTVGRCT